ncbi:MAG: S1 family peptidase [Acidimicrobiales bacterium]
MTRTLRLLLLPVLLLLAFALRPMAADAVVGGSPVPDGKYPFMAAVLDDGSQFCGGSVIASTWVLTAAHCVADGSAAGLSVSVGDSDWAQGTRIPVTQVFVHLAYDDSSQANDAALLRLASAAPVAPITLAGPGDDAFEAHGAPVTVAGWGSIIPIVGLLPPLDSQMREAALTVVGDAQCTQDNDPATQVCAEALLRDSCQGDSGGPLFATAPGGARIQVGIVSYGLGCAVPLFPGVYSEVNSPSIRSFISQTAGV